MSRQHLPLFIALAAGIGLSACGEVSTPPVAGTTTANAMPTANGNGTVPPAMPTAAMEAAATAATAAAELDDATATPGTTRAQDGAAALASPAADATDEPRALPRLVVTKTPTCGCCHLWVEHMRNAGFQVEVHDVEDMGPVKERVGVPYGKGSCHTAEVGGYFVEGHVPAADVKRLLAEKPDAKGLAVPGMPAGSPGMEMPDGRVQPYAVELVAQDGSTSVFAHHGR